MDPPASLEIVCGERGVVINPKHRLFNVQELGWVVDTIDGLEKMGYKAAHYPEIKELWRVAKDTGFYPYIFRMKKSSPVTIHMPVEFIRRPYREDSPVLVESMEVRMASWNLCWTSSDGKITTLIPLECTETIQTLPAVAILKPSNMMHAKVAWCPAKITSKETMTTNSLTFPLTLEEAPMEKRPSEIALIHNEKLVWKENFEPFWRSLASFQSDESTRATYDMRGVTSHHIYLKIKFDEGCSYLDKVETARDR